ncbi:MAG: ATP-binding protein [Syntrophobacteraceae bacterium]
MDKEMKIAIIGGGRRCKAFLEMFDGKRFPRLHAKIVAVADPNPDAAGIRIARERNIYTTPDYKNFYSIKDLDLVIELTGKEELLVDFLRNKPARVRVLEATISRLFGDVLRMREEFLFTRRQVDLVEGIMNSLFISLRDWILVMQPDFRLLDVNDAFLDAVRTSKEDVIGKHCYQAAYGATGHCGGDGFYCPVKRCLETESIAHAILERSGAEGSARYQEITAVPLKASNGRIELVVEIFRDITDELEKRIEEKTLALKQDLMRLIHDEKMISLGKMAASAVHEINNPLSGINALARLMETELAEGEKFGPLEKERHLHYLNLISTESARVSSIVSDLLQFSRQTRGRRDYFQLNDAVRKAVQFIRYRLDSQHIGAHLVLDDGIPSMHGDQGQVQQGLLNLLFNAMDAMPEGGELTVKTSWDQSASKIRLEVADTGTGIPKDLIPLIFEPFFSTKGRDKGVGLGLSVVYGIVKEHGGSIYVRSEEGAGARFLIGFPVSCPAH